MYPLTKYRVLLVDAQGTVIDEFEIDELETNNPMTYKFLADDLYDTVQQAENERR